MLRSALVALDGSSYSDSAVALAIDWARRFGARLLAVGVLDVPSIRRAEPVPLGAGAYKKARDEARLGEAHRRVVDFLVDFQARSSAAGVAAEVIEDIGDPAERILREAQRCDVVILARETHFHFETQDEPDETLAQVLRGSPRPVVVVPRELPDGQGIVLAYGGGREAARTLQAFQLLGLAANEMIDVVSIARQDAEVEALTRLAGEYLAAHGAPHRLHAIVSTTPPAEVLLEEVRRARPRLLVMGAHGHHPLRDLFATSVTRAVLRACPVPAFIGA
ncbi:MAG TPA: universal stress protein [Methylomirabilota bacterium]|nr:universal stress protein [Methylomirabilota bacterium]